MSRSQGPTDWSAWFGWSGDGLWRSPAGAAMDGYQLPIPSLSPIAVSIIIPVGPGHEELFWDALDSIEAQKYLFWETIVIWDSHEPMPQIPSWVKVRRSGGVGVAAARNLGASMATGKWLLPLDADDYLMPNALATFTDLARQNPGVILYSDFWEDPDVAGEFKVYETPDWDAKLLVRKGLIGAVTQLIPREVFDQIGGYDPTLPAWEDWGFALEAAKLGICSRRIPLPLLTYRKHTGHRRVENMAMFDQGKAAIQSRYAEFWKGEEPLACRKCGSGRAAVVAQSRSSAIPAGAESMTLMSYDGPLIAGFNRRGPSGNMYRWFRGAVLYVFNSDVEHFLKYEGFSKAPVIGDASETPELQSYNPA